MPLHRREEALLRDGAVLVERAAGGVGADRHLPHQELAEDGVDGVEDARLLEEIARREDADRLHVVGDDLSVVAQRRQVQRLEQRRTGDELIESNADLRGQVRMIEKDIIGLADDET